MGAVGVFARHAQFGGAAPGGGDRCAQLPFTAGQQRGDEFGEENSVTAGFAQDRSGAGKIDAMFPAVQLADFQQQAAQFGTADDRGEISCRLNAQLRRPIQTSLKLGDVVAGKQIGGIVQIGRHFQPLLIDHIRVERGVDRRPIHLQLRGDQAFHLCFRSLEHGIDGRHQWMIFSRQRKHFHAQLRCFTARIFFKFGGVIEQFAKRIDTAAIAIGFIGEDGLNRAVQIPPNTTDAVAIDGEHPFGIRNVMGMRTAGELVGRGDAVMEGDDGLVGGEHGVVSPIRPMERAWTFGCVHPE